MRDVSRWSEIRLVVVRPVASDQAVWSVVQRSVEGASRRDRLLLRGLIPCAPASPSSQSWYAALLAALEAARSSGPSEDPSAEGGAGVPQGGLQGGI